MNKQQLISTVVAAAAITLTSAAHAGTIRYVDDGAPAGGDGLSWDTAYQDVQPALSDVALGVVLIRVAGGTYAAGSQLNLPGGVALVGGFAGFGAPNPDQRDTVLFETNLSGENSYGILQAVGIHTTILDGFTLRDGKRLPSGAGGALRVGNAIFIALDCRFISNTASSGGAVRVDFPSIASFLNCVFTDNVSANSGGALAAFGSSAGPATVSLTDCVFESNSTTNPGSDGGAIQVNTNVILIASNCSFLSNTSINRGGACFFESTAGAEITTCTFDLNNAGSLGGAIFTSASTPVTLKACVFTANTAQNGGALAGFSSGSTPAFAIIRSTFVSNVAADLGGGILLNFAAATITNCSFGANDSGAGGAIYSLDGDATIWNCLFRNNTAVLGGAVGNRGGILSLINCSLSGNLADDSGGGLFAAGGSQTITNSILWANTDLGGMDETAQIDGIASSPVVNYSDVQGGWSGLGGIGNISTDPKFVDPDGADDIPGTEDDDFRLQPGSPCIDAGDNTAVPAGIVIDLDGDPRFHDDTGTPDTGNPDGSNPIVDLGAYEFQGTTCLPDINGDHVINVLDLIDLLLCFGQPAVPGCEREDVNRDDTVNVLDLIDLLVEFGRACP